MVGLAEVFGDWLVGAVVINVSQVFTDADGQGAGSFTHIDFLAVLALNAVHQVAALTSEGPGDVVGTYRALDVSVWIEEGTDLAVLLGAAVGSRNKGRVRGAEFGADKEIAEVTIPFVGAQRRCLEGIRYELRRGRGKNVPVGSKDPDYR